MITLPFGKIDLVFMLLPRRLLLVQMIVGVVVTRCRVRSLFSPSTSCCVSSGRRMFLRAVDVVDGFVDVLLCGLVVTTRKRPTNGALPVRH
mgnify:CR=1 FL=1